MLKRCVNRFRHFLSTRVGLVVGLTSIFGVFLSIVVSRIGVASFWFDEGYTAILSRQDLGSIFKYTALDVHPPLYYWLVHFWTDIFGTTDVAFRSLSVVFSLIALALLFYLIKKLFSQSLAIISTFTVAILPIFIRYSVEARMYSMVLVICLAATIVLVKALQSKNNTTKRNWYITYGILLAIGMLTHYFTAIVWLAHWVYRAVYLRRFCQQNYKVSGWLAEKKVVTGENFWSKKWVWSHILAIVIFLPWANYLIQQFLAVSRGFWIKPVSMGSIGDFLSRTFYFTASKEATDYSFVLLLAVVSFVAYALFKVYPSLKVKAKEGLLLVLTMAFLPPLFLILLSLPPLPSAFIHRYLVTSAVFCGVLAILTLCLYIIRFQSSRYRLISAVAFLIMFFAVLIKGQANIFYGNNVSNIFTVDNDSRNYTKQIIHQVNDIDNSKTPILMLNHQLYLEGAIYKTANHPIYMIANQLGGQDGPSVLLHDKEHSVAVDDLNDFMFKNGQVWTIIYGDGSKDLVPISWQKVKRVEIKNPDVNGGGSQYVATLYQINSGLYTKW